MTIFINQVWLSIVRFYLGWLFQQWLWSLHTTTVAAKSSSCTPLSNCYNPLNSCTHGQQLFIL